MKPHVSALERAFELAQSGRYDNVELIRRELNAEGYQGAEIMGPALLKQLRDLIAQHFGKVTVRS